MKILAIDYGTKRIGFAIGNTSIFTTAPLDPFPYKKKTQALDHIKKLVAEYEIGLVLVGYPLHMDGAKSTTTEAVERFRDHLKKVLPPGVAAEFVDERLSSFEAAEELKTLRPEFKRKQAVMDSMAAVMILRRFMENQ